MPEQFNQTLADDQVRATIAKLNAETAKLIAETTKLQTETTLKLSAETAKIQAEAKWYPFVVLAGVLGAALGLFKLLTA